MCWPKLEFFAKKALDVVVKAEKQLNVVSSSEKQVQTTNPEAVNEIDEVTMREMISEEAREILSAASLSIRNAEDKAYRTVAALREASDIVEEMVEKNFGENK